MEMNLFLLMAMFFFFGGGVVTVIVMVLQVKKHRPVKMAENADQYVVPAETKMTNTTDLFLRTRTTRVKVSSSSSKRK